MPRCGRFRNFIKEFKESERFEKLSFIPPFIILLLELILLVHALTEDTSDLLVVELTTVLLIISLVEIFLVSREIHEHYQKDSFHQEMTIRLDDFILEKRMDNVSRIVEEFLNENRKYCKDRNAIYHLACQIMDTHKRELWEKTLHTRLKRFLKQTDKEIIRDIIESFMQKYPEYRKDPGRVYEITAQLIENYN
jgi:hypothetical protein